MTITERMNHVLNTLVKKYPDMRCQFDEGDSLEIFGYDYNMVSAIMDHFEDSGLIRQQKYKGGRIIRILISAHELVDQGGFLSKEESVHKYTPEEFLSVFKPEINENLKNNSVEISTEEFIGFLINVIRQLNPNRRFETVTRNLLGNAFLNCSFHTYAEHWLLKSLMDDDSYTYAYNALAQKINRDNRDDIYTVKNNPFHKIDELLNKESSISNQNLQNNKINYRDVPEIFISYSWKNKTLVDQIDSDLNELGLKLTRDIRDIDFKNSIKDFMKSIRSHDFIIMIISESFLKSESCMFEVMEIIKDPNYQKRILQVILSDAQIFKIEDRIQYIDYWVKRQKALNDKLKMLDPKNFGNLPQELKHIDNICENIYSFLEFLSSEKSISYEAMRASNYKVLIEYINLSH